MSNSSESGSGGLTGIVLVVLVGLFVLGLAVVLSFYAVNPPGPTSEVADIRVESTHQGDTVVVYNESELPSDAVVVNTSDLTATQASQLYDSIQGHEVVVNTTGLREGMFVKSGGSYYQIVIEEVHDTSGVFAAFAVIGWILVFVYISFLIMLDDAAGMDDVEEDSGGE